MPDFPIQHTPGFLENAATTATLTIAGLAGGTRIYDVAVDAGDITLALDIWAD